jgi:hypothetical protein
MTKKYRPDYSNLKHIASPTNKFVNDVFSKLEHKANVPSEEIYILLTTESEILFDKNEVRICFLWHGAGNRWCVNLPDNVRTVGKDWDETVDNMVASILMARVAGNEHARRAREGQRQADT